MQPLELRIGLEAVLPLDETPDPAVHRFLGRGREFLGAGVGDLGDGLLLILVRFIVRQDVVFLLQYPFELLWGGETHLELRPQGTFSADAVSFWGRSRHFSVAPAAC